MRFLAPVALLALAIVAALLAGDVRAWHRTLTTSSALVTVSPRTATWNPSTNVPFGAAEALLGVSDDVEVQRGVAKYLYAASIPIRLDNANFVAGVRTRAEDALAEIARSSNHARASQAQTLNGVMLFGDLAQHVGVTGLQPTGIGRSQADAALAAFTDAVRLDPDDVTAKYDLELLLRALLLQGTRVGPGSQGGTSTGRHGAGGGIPGQGY
jgi:hypothetical protein